MNGGTSNPKWVVTAATVSAFTMFLPSIHDVRHAEPGDKIAHDCRFGYAFALGYSFLVGIVVASDNSPEATLVAWLAAAGLLIVIYESLLRSRDAERQS